MATTVISARKLFKQSFQDFWKYRWKLMGLVLIIAAPLTLLNNLTPNSSADTSLTAYGTFLSLIMSVALIWLIIQIKNGKVPTVREAYYRGTASLVRLLLITAVLVLSLVPFILGGLIYVSGTTGTLTAGTGEKLVLGLVWFVFALPSFWLIMRWLLAIYIVVGDDMTPLAALRRSASLVKGKLLKVTGRLVLLGLISILILTVPAILILSGPTSLLITIGLILLQLISQLIILPITNLYMYGLYQDLAS